MASFYIDGDGRRTLFPHNSPVGVKSQWIRRSAARVIISEFMDTGLFHAHAGAHAWVIFNYCVEQGIAYTSRTLHFDDNDSNPIEWIVIEKSTQPAQKTLLPEGKQMPLNIKHHAVIVTGVEHDPLFSRALETARKYFKPDFIIGPTTGNRNAISTFTVTPSGYTEYTDEDKDHSNAVIDFCTEMKGYPSVSYVALSWAATDSPTIDDAHILD